MNGSYDEFAATVERWDGENNYGRYGRLWMEREQEMLPEWEPDVTYGEKMYLEYMEMISMSGTKILGALLFTIIMYVSLSNTSFTDHWGNFSYPLLEAWWYWSRWVLGLGIYFIIMGVWYFLTAMYINYKLRRPMPKFERDWGDEDDPALDIDSMRDAFGQYRKRPKNFLAQQGWESIALPVLVVFFGLLSFGLAEKSRLYVANRARDVSKMRDLQDALVEILGAELTSKFGHFLFAARLDPEDFGELTDPYFIHLILKIPLGPAIKIAKKFKHIKTNSGLTTGGIQEKTGLE